MTKIFLQICMILMALSSIGARADNRTTLTFANQATYVQIKYFPQGGGYMGRPGVGGLVSPKDVTTFTDEKIVMILTRIANTMEQIPSAKKYQRGKFWWTFGFYLGYEFNLEQRHHTVYVDRDGRIAEYNGNFYQLPFGWLDKMLAFDICVER